MKLKIQDISLRTNLKNIVGAQRAVSLLLSIIFALTACNPAEPTATPAPTPIPTVTSNASWTPVVRDFNSVEMVQVPPGCFTMGNEDGRRDERPEHEICFDAPYWIDRYEVTNAQYGAQGNFPGDDHPRENLTWFEARDFCVSRGARLPTEAEWEYAARGPDNLMYPWGNELVEENLIFDRNANNETADVGSYRGGVSWVGAYDMSGNVYEWVSSIYARYPYDATDGREDMTDTTSARVYRSGWASYIDFGVSTAIRFRADPNTRDWFIGFRCASSE
jgi:formylglycine-generating enzyme required for sulfatase activity